MDNIILWEWLEFCWKGFTDKSYNSSFKPKFKIKTAYEDAIEQVKKEWFIN